MGKSAETKNSSFSIARVALAGLLASVVVAAAIIYWPGPPKLSDAGNEAALAIYQMSARRMKTSVLFMEERMKSLPESERECLMEPIELVRQDKWDEAIEKIRQIMDAQTDG